MKTPWTSPVIASVLIILVTFAAYAPALRAGFVWDDDELVTENNLIKAPDGLYRFWCTTQPTDYWPLTSTTWLLEWRLWGKNPFGYHLVNVILHALSAVLWWRVLARLKIPGAWFGAALFAVHPICVESVAWIAERKNTLSMLFYVGTILSYLRFEDTNRCRWYWLAVAMFALALLSKTAVVALPVVLLLGAWWRRRKVDRSDLTRILPFLVLSVAMGLITIWFQSRMGVSQGMLHRGVGLRVAGAGWAGCFYLWKALVPVNLMTVYPQWQINPSSPIAYWPTAIVLVCLALFWRHRQAWGRPLLFASSYFLVMLVPVLGIANMTYLALSPVADRFLYFSLIGVTASVCAAGARLSRAHRGAIRPLINGSAVVMVALFAVLTYRQNAVYKDPETLWRAALERNPESWVAQNGLGSALQARDTTAAIAHYAQALRLKPDYVEALNNLGNALLDLGQRPEAVAHFEQALRVAPNSARLHYNLAGALLQQGKQKDAIEHLEQAVRIKPDYAEAHNNLAAAFMQEGRLTEAIEHFSLALRINPNYAEAHNNLAAALVQTGQITEAAAHLKEALRIDPQYVQARKNLGQILWSLGKTSEAANQYEQVLRMAPDDVEARNALQRLRSRR
jgi:Tfp pilus assembly protein PilF